MALSSLIVIPVMYGMDEKDIYRSAKLLIDKHGEDASVIAALRADELLAVQEERRRAAHPDFGGLLHVAFDDGGKSGVLPVRVELGHVQVDLLGELDQLGLVQPPGVLEVPRE